MILVGDVLERLADLEPESVQCCVTSPPYFGLRSYLPADHPDKAKEVGTEKTPEEYTARLVEVFRGVRRVIHPSGTVWLNLGDSFAGGTMAGGSGTRSTLVGTHHAKRTGTESIGPRLTPGLKPKDLIGIPWRVAFALQADGWYLRQAVTWCKTAPMPESVSDRPTSATEMVFLLTRSARYFYDADAVRQPCSPTSHGGPNVVPGRKYTMLGQGSGNLGKWTAEQKAAGRNLWNYWLINPEPFPGAHYAVMPQKLVEPCILAGTSEAGCCRTCGAPWERDNGFKNGDNGRYGSDVYLPEVPSRATAIGLWDGQPEEGRAAVLVPRVRSGSAQTELGSEPRADEGAAPPVSRDSPAAIEGAQAAVSSHSQGQGADAGAEQRVQTNRKGQGVSARVSPQEQSEGSSQDQGQNASVEAACVTAQCAGDVHRCGLAEDSSGTATTLSLLRSAIHAEAATDHRPCDPSIEGRGAQPRKHRRRLPPVQQPQVEPASGIVGWRPTCTHTGEPWPCQVLDPFLGSGTVGLVAERLGRRWVGIELDERSAQIARDRTAQLGFGRLLAAGGAG